MGICGSASKNKVKNDESKDFESKKKTDDDPSNLSNTDPQNQPRPAPHEAPQKMSNAQSKDSKKFDP